MSNHAIQKSGRNGSPPKPARLMSPEHLPLAKRFFLSLREKEHSFFLADQIERAVDEFLDACASDVACARDARTRDSSQAAAGALRRMLRGCQEIVLYADYAYALLRQKIGAKRIVRLHPELQHFEEVSRADYLFVKDAYAQGEEMASRPGLSLNFAPFFQSFPKVREPSEMGEGISFLNRHLSGQMYQNPDVFRRALLEFLRESRLDETDLFANERLASPAALDEELDAARALVADVPPETPFADLCADLKAHGFEAGWGATAKIIGESLASLARLVESPDPERFEKFLARLPLARTVVMVSPHGWFAQEGVLGKPDTGGQVTYVLDQARALERQMIEDFERAGVEARPHIAILTRLIPSAEGTSCNVPREKVHGTENAWIVRAPFRDARGEVVPDWISRFHIWPYLEGFAEESKAVVLTELMGKPDLIIGNYSDGNLVAHLLADDLGVTHCALAHALEKTKYLFSDLRWANMERDYRFSLQFTAGIIAYNSADFIVTSTYREIAGSDTEMGMFESYETFSMPGLYRAISGMDPQLARYNIVPPGASEEYFFPNSERDRRVEAMGERLAESLLGPEPGPNARGRLERPELPPIFAMSRVDKVKNLPGLIEAFGRSESLREKANLVIVSSLIDARQSNDQEEIEQIHQMEELIERHGLEGSLRWAASRLGKDETGEVYRVMADRRGVFAQPALMETFGLTVIEAMACGLPVVVTCFGGPAEIVIPGVSGEIENPNDHAAFAAALERVIADAETWEARAEAGVRRVRDAFSWSAHARKIFRLANVYSYWNYLDVMNRQALDQYTHMLYHAVYRPRANALLGKGAPS